VRDAVDRASQQDVTRAAAISHRARRGALAGGLVALALALAVGAWTTWRLTQPLDRLRDAMANVAAGDFVTPADLPQGQQDEIGDLARSFRAMTERLAQLDHVKGEFVNAISHDLKAPLGMIGTCAELIEERAGGGLPPDQRELLATIREHVRVLAERVGKLLHLSRLESGGFPIQPEPVPVRHVFDAVRRTFAPEAERRGLAITVQVEPSLPSLMTVDADCLYNEILGNLVSNAFKFTPRGGAVEVRAWGAQPPDGDGDGDGDGGCELHVAVSDTGIGIPDAELPFVFLKYYQVGGRRRAEGAGLGLAIVRHAVEAHEGTVTVDSTVGRGTSFHVTLPVGGPQRNGRSAQRRRAPLPAPRYRTLAPAPRASRV
jgi:signal transduction histidine kinase